MQEQSMNWVQSGEMSKQFEAMIKESEDQQSKYTWAAEEVKKATTNLPEGMRTPTAEEIQSMEQFAIEYRKNKPNASNREVRRATQRKFQVKMLPNT